MTDPSGGDKRRSLSTTERITEILRERITDGQIAPGAPIRQDAVAVELGASRIPVRDALARLAAEGLVVLSSNKTARARLLLQRDLEEVYEIRKALEMLAVSCSAERVSDAELEEIQRTRLMVETVRDDVRASLDADEVFHLTCYRAANLPTLLSLIEGFWRVTRVYRMTTWPQLSDSDKARAFREHRQIEEALRDRQPEVAKEVTRLHLQHTLDRLKASPHLFAPNNKATHKGQDES